MSEFSAELSEIKIDLVPWWLVLLEGLAALIIGIYLFISPAPTVVLLVAILGWYWLITGILTLVTLIMDRTNATWRALSALLGIVAGIVIIGHPFWSAAIVPGTLVIIAGVLGVCFGFISLFWARGVQRGMGRGCDGSYQHHLRPCADRISTNRHRYADLHSRRARRRRRDCIHLSCS